MSGSSKTNWERFDALTDDAIDTSDTPPLGDEFFAEAVWLMPGEKLPYPQSKQIKSYFGASTKTSTT